MEKLVKFWCVWVLGATKRRRRKVKLAFIGSGIYPIKVGGTELAVFELAKRLNDKFDLNIVFPGGRRDFARAKALRRFKVYRCFGSVKKKQGRLLEYLSFLGRMVTIFFHLVRILPDVVFSFGISTYSFTGLLYSKLFRKKIIARAEGLDLVDESSLQIKANKWTCKEADLVFFTSIVHKGIIEKASPKRKPLFLANGTSFARRSIERGGGKVRALFVGTLKGVKNPTTIIKALHLLKLENEHLPISLTICGEGPLMEEIEKMVEDFNLSSVVKLMGRVDHERLKKIYQEHDVLVLPSVSEGFPLVVAEALGMGLAIVCSDIPSLRAVLMEKVNALFFSPLDPSDLGRQLKLLALNGDFLFSMRKNNLKLGRKFSWERVAATLEKYLKAIVGGV